MASFMHPDGRVNLEVLPKMLSRLPQHRFFTVSGDYGMEHSCQLSILRREVVPIERKSNQTDSFIPLLA